MPNRVVIPTFFLVEDKSVDKNEIVINRKLVRKYDAQVLEQLMKKRQDQKKVLGEGSVFNAYLQNLENVTPGNKHKNLHEFYHVDEDGIENQLNFYLPEIENNNRMLYMELVSMTQCIENEPLNILGVMGISVEKEREDEDKIVEFLKENKDTIFARVVFWAENDLRCESKKNLGKFLCLRENYIGSMEKDSSKYMLVTDESINIHYVFKCWIEELPIPSEAVDSKIYAYVDGSSDNLTPYEDGYPFGTGAILCYDDVRISHQKGNDFGGNYAAELKAATKVLQFLCENRVDWFEKSKERELHFYFDCTHVGYVPLDLWGNENKQKTKDNKLVQCYLKAIEEFEEKYPNIRLVFEHVDAHTAIFGNEMADRLAAVKPAKKEGVTACKNRKETMDSRDKIWAQSDNSFKVFKKK